MNVGPEQLNLPHVGVEANITSSSSSSQRTHGNAFKLAAAAPRVFAKRWSLKKRRIGCNNSNNNRDSSSNIKVSTKFFSKIKICGCRNILWRFLFRFLRPHLNRKTCSWRNFTLGWVYKPSPLRRKLCIPMMIGQKSFHFDLKKLSRSKTYES